MFQPIFQPSARGFAKDQATPADSYMAVSTVRIEDAAEHVLHQGLRTEAEGHAEDAGAGDERCDLDS